MFWNSKNNFQGTIFQIKIECGFHTWNLYILLFLAFNQLGIKDEMNVEHLLHIELEASGFHEEDLSIKFQHYARWANKTNRTWKEKRGLKMFYEGNLLFMLTNRGVHMNQVLTLTFNLILLTMTLKKIRFFWPCFRFALGHLHHPIMGQLFTFSHLLQHHFQFHHL
jgi:hypothetical protein